MTIRTNRGFSLLELIVVIGIFGMLIAFSVPAYNAYSGSQQLKGTAQTVASTFKLARERAISTGVRQLVHVNTLGGVNWHIHRYHPNGTVTIAYGEKFPKGITTYTVSVWPEFKTDGRSSQSGLVVLRDARGNRDTVSVLQSGIILTK